MVKGWNGWKKRMGWMDERKECGEWINEEVCWREKREVCGKREWRKKRIIVGGGWGRRKVVRIE